MQTTSPQPVAQLASGLIIAAVEPAMNEPNINIQGRRTVRIDALLDYDGLSLLEEQIKALKMLLIKPASSAPPSQRAQLPPPPDDETVQ